MNTSVPEVLGAWGAGGANALPEEDCVDVEAELRCAAADDEAEESIFRGWSQR
jgi:hypothetical protein